MKVGVNILNIRDNKGIALIEMIVVLALIVIVLPLILQLYMFGQETFSYGNKLIAQQYTVTTTMQHIRGDIQNAASVETSATYMNPGDPYPKVITLKLGYISSGSTTIDKFRYWRFYSNAANEGTLERSEETSESNPTALVDSDYSKVVTGLDITGCVFSRTVSDPYKLTVKIKPLETNSGKWTSKNMRESIITEISVLYKY